MDAAANLSKLCSKKKRDNASFQREMRQHIERNTNLIAVLTSHRNTVDTITTLIEWRISPIRFVEFCWFCYGCWWYWRGNGTFIRNTTFPSFIDFRICATDTAKLWRPILRNTIEIWYQIREVPRNLNTFTFKDDEEQPYANMHSQLH